MEGAKAAFEKHFGATQPRLLRIGKYDSDCDLSVYSVDLELAPGVRIPVECGLVETIDEGRYEIDADTVINDVREAVSACKPLIGRIADAMPELRLRARRIVAAWQREGLQVRMASVQLRSYDHWRGDIDPQFEIVLDATDIGAEWLPPHLYIQTPDALKTEMAEFHATLVYLSKFRRDNIVTEAVSEIGGGSLSSVRVTVSMPKRLFCTTSGRVRDDVSGSDGALGDGLTEVGSNVVPIKPRRSPSAA